MLRSTSAFHKLGALVFVIVLTGTVAAVNAEPPFMRGGDRGLWKTEKLAMKLELTDEQRDRIEALEDASRERMRVHVRSLLQGHEAMRVLVEAETFDEPALRKLASQHSAAMTEMMVERARKRHAIHALLTPDQRQKMAHKQRRHSQKEPH